MCTFVTASGLAWLEMAANSFIVVLGGPDMAAFRLVFAQSWNGVASVLGPIIAGRTFLKTGHSHSKYTVEASKRIETPKLMPCFFFLVEQL